MLAVEIPKGSETAATPHDQIDREGELERGLWNREERVGAVLLVDVEQHGDGRREEERTANDAQERQAPRHQAGAIHHPAQEDAVDADAEPGAEEERPVVDGDERLPGDFQRRRVRGPGEVVAQCEDR